MDSPHKVLLMLNIDFIWCWPEQVIEQRVDRRHDAHVTHVASLK